MATDNEDLQLRVPRLIQFFKLLQDVFQAEEQGNPRDFKQEQENVEREIEEKKAAIRRLEEGWRDGKINNKAWQAHVATLKAERDFLEAFQAKKRKIDEEAKLFNKSKQPRFLSIKKQLEDLKKGVGDKEKIIRVLEGYVGLIADEHQRRDLQEQLAQIAPNPMAVLKSKDEIKIPGGNVKDKIKAFTPQPVSPPSLDRTGKIWKKPPVDPTPPTAKKRLKAWGPPKDPIVGIGKKAFQERQQAIANAFKPLNTWGLFFDPHARDVFRQDSLHAAVPKVTIVPVTASVFKQNFKKIGEALQTHQNTGNIKSFTIENQADKHYQVYRGTDKSTPSIVEISHISTTIGATDNPKSLEGKIEILMTDPEQKDDALYLMVVAAKEVLDNLGRTRFSIEQCANTPDIAVKLYIIGKSLGLDPVFKNEPGTLKIEESIQRTTGSKLRLKDNDQEFSLKEIYERARVCTPEEAKTLIERLEIERSAPSLAPPYPGAVRVLPPAAIPPAPPPPPVGFKPPR